MWLYGWKILTINHHAVEFDCHKHCGCGDQTLIIYQEVTSFKNSNGEQFPLEEPEEENVESAIAKTNNQDISPLNFLYSDWITWKA